MSETRKPLNPFQYLFEKDQKVEDQKAEDKKTEADALKGLELIEHIAATSEPPVTIKLKPELKSNLEKFQCALEQIDIGSWIRSKTQKHKGELSTEQLLNLLGLKEIEDLIFITAMWNHTRNNLKHITCMQSFFLKGEFDIFKFFIKYGMHLKDNENLDALLLINVISAYGDGDVLDMILAEDDLMKHFIIRHESQYHYIARALISLDKFYLLEKIFNLTYADKIKENIEKFLEDPIKEKNFEKIKAVATYPFFDPAHLNSAIKFAIENLQPELYQKLLKNPLITALDGLKVSTENSVGHIDADSLVALLKSKSEQSKSIFSALLSSIKKWDSSTSALRSIISDYVNHSQIKMTREDYINHLVDFIFLPKKIVNDDRDDREKKEDNTRDVNELEIFKLLLKLDQSQLFSSKFLTHEDVDLLLMLSKKNNREDLCGLLLEHRKSIAVSSAAVLEEKYAEIKDAPFEKAKTAIDFKKHFGEKSVKECITNLEEFAADSKKVEALFVKCLGNEALEKELKEAFEALYKKTKKSIFHFLVEADEANHEFIRVLLIFTAKSDAALGAPLVDYLDMMPLDIACSLGHHQKIAVLLKDERYREYYWWGSNKIQSTIKYAMRNKDPMVLSTCMKALRDNWALNRAVQDQYEKNQNYLDVARFNKVGELFTLHTCQHHPYNHLAQFEMLRCLDQIIHHEPSTLSTSDYWDVYHNWFDKCVIYGGEKFITKFNLLTSRENKLLDALTVAYTDLKELKLDADEWKIYINAMQLIKSSPEARIQGLSLLRQLKEKNQNINIQFAIDNCAKIDDDIYYILQNSHKQLINVITIAYANVKKSSLDLKSANLYLKAMYLLGCGNNMREAFFLINELRKCNQSLKDKISFAPFDSFIICHLSDYDSYKSFIELGFKFRDVEDSKLENAAEQQKTFNQSVFRHWQIQKDETCDLIASMCTRQDNFYIDALTTDEGFATLKECIKFGKKNVDIGSALQLVYDKFQSQEKPKKAYELLCYMLRFGYFDPTKPYAKDHILTRCVSSSPLISEILLNAMMFDMHDTVKGIKDIRAAHGRSYIDTWGLTFDKDIEKGLSLSGDYQVSTYCARYHVNSLEELTMKLPKIDYDAKLIIFLCIYSFGFRQREDLLTQSFLESKPGQQNILHKFVTNANVLKIIIKYFVRHYQLAYQRDQSGLSPLHYAAKLGAVEQFKLLLDSGQPLEYFFNPMQEPTILQCLNQSQGAQINTPEYKACVVYLFRKKQFTRDEVANQLGIKFNLEGLTDRQIEILVRFYNLSRSPDNVFEFLQENSSDTSQRIAIAMIEKLFAGFLRIRSDTTYQFVKGVTDYKIINLVDKIFNSFGLSRHALVFIETMKHITTLSPSHPHVAKELMICLSLHCRFDKPNPEVLAQFALTVATMTRFEYTKGWFCCPSGERIAVKHIDPFIEKIDRIMTYTNPSQRLEELRKEINSLDSNNPLKEAFSVYKAKSVYNVLMWQDDSSSKEMKYEKRLGR